MRGELTSVKDVTGRQPTVWIIIRETVKRNKIIANPGLMASALGANVFGSQDPSGPFVPVTVLVKLLPRIEGHQYFSMCSMTSSTPRAWLT